MSWVEELTPDDEVEVEVIYPKFYVDHNMATMKKYSAAAAYYCRAAATIGQEKIRFKLPGVTVVQVQCIESAMKTYGVEMTHRYIDGVRYFYADVSRLKKILEENGEE